MASRHHFVMMLFDSPDGDTVPAYNAVEATLHSVTL